MRLDEFLTDEQLDELDWRKKLATGAMALGALGITPAQAKVQQPHASVQQVKQKYQTPAQQKELDKLIQQVSKQPSALDKKKAELTKNAQTVKQQSFDPNKLKPLEKHLYTAANSNQIKDIELAQFMGQMKKETGNFSSMFEIGTDEYFDRYNPNSKIPENAARGKLLGNLDEKDAITFKGRGYVQLTGRDNYRMASKAIGEDLLKNPDLAGRPDIAAKIALWYWNTRVKPKVGGNFQNTRKVTYFINSGLRGLDDREENFLDYKKKFGIA